MKWLIASDIHGSAYYCQKLIEAYKTENADKLLLLGDLLYHGPRNDLPKEYNPKQVLKMLNDIKSEILCVKGNCDGDVDQMVLEFPILAEYAIISIDKNIIFATHGHKINVEHPPALKNGDILLYGHTHIPKCEKYDEFTYLNPGSVSIPKENSAHSYMTFDGKVFKWKNLLDGNTYMRHTL